MLPLTVVVLSARSGLTLDPERSTALHHTAMLGCTVCELFCAVHFPSLRHFLDQEVVESKNNLELATPGQRWSEGTRRQVYPQSCWQATAARHVIYFLSIPTKEQQCDWGAVWQSRCLRSQKPSLKNRAPSTRGAHKEPFSLVCAGYNGTLA